MTNTSFDTTSVATEARSQVLRFRVLTFWRAKYIVGWKVFFIISLKQSFLVTTKLGKAQKMFLVHCLRLPSRS